MGRLTISYSNYCHDSGILFNRAVSKYFRNCGARNDSSESSRGSSSGENGTLDVERSICNGAYGRSNQKWEETTCSESEEDEFEGSVELIDENRLCYRAEGNANIVLSLSDSRQVLRLRKSAVDEHNRKDSNVDLRRFVKYSTMTASLFSRRYVPEPKLARLSCRRLEEFNANLTKYRPVIRLNKEIRLCDGILYPDVAFLPEKLYPIELAQSGDAQDAKGLSFNTYCVEIKPKQGWSFLDECHGDDPDRQRAFLDYEKSILPELMGVRKCRYCLYQYLKLQKNTVGKVSKYCPLDLYSGKPVRMLHAIKGLIGAPQNNFKLLRNGRIVYDEKQDKSVFNRVLKEIFSRDGRTKEERKTIFMNLIKEILLKDFTTYDEAPTCDRRLLSIRKNRKKKDTNLIHLRSCSPINYEFLPKNCALKQILDAQLLVKSSLLKIHTDTFRQDNSTADSFVYIDELFEKYVDYLEDCPCCGEREGNGNFSDTYLSEEERYQLGATAMDCSVMITFRRLTDREEIRLPPAAENHIVDIASMQFLVNVTITDLDPKSLDHHRKYLKQLRDSAGAYREFMARIKRKSCG
ncbi:inositol-pentakisphosphate 2-kinase [Toxorhynchites rutilus septentrionalis]|uniref:inositol-pentakisphosphate 2-kinase n=1 Tax=Toxorhynchites rutilus septentrionalis TaxID=329112 RepID=UPI002479F131|nr:inositol-pentakisphosphate 2-kinase [Toxorhynchites rutilus septentrionalis]XP_055638821.1 inositol-pentakisphosphate 2-kinase [Toxorhynchites rutilus septentrionalis]XP_055638822.1 inositol-pentakisphosphate 2-kinase [Toxorhynchites rutilus septentrionalis]XP_055638823.1 inositol-pentakisphosphate 2-kinase [Toxorhynchites rutilus septentrionalis]XP_055638824.1 inositol-pentakisphosphate 2-kinase [Toxorhynchites rutilus septentrionalis]